MKNLIWLASYPKSGNTWLRIFLTSYILDKRVYINKIYGTPSTGSRKLFEHYSGKNSFDLTNDEIDNLRPDVWRKFSEDNEDQELVLVKIHDCCHKNKNGEYIIPLEKTKGIVHIVRNPLDVCVSYSFHNDTDVASMSKVVNNKNHAMCASEDKDRKQLRQILTSWEQHAFSWQSQKLTVPMLELRYEDMVQKPETVFKVLIDFCGLPFDEEKLQRAINSSRLSRLQSQEEKYGFKEKSERSKRFFRSGKIGDWKNHLSESQVAVIVKENKEAMKLYSYLDKKGKIDELIS